MVTNKAAALAGSKHSNSSEYTLPSRKSKSVLTGCICARQHKLVGEAEHFIRDIS